MDATITQPPVRTPAPRWDADNATAIKHAEDLHRHGVTPEEAFGAVSSCPEYQPVAEALERVAEAGCALIREAARR